MAPKLSLKREKASTEQASGESEAPKGLIALPLVFVPSYVFETSEQQYRAIAALYNKTKNQALQAEVAFKQLEATEQAEYRSKTRNRDSTLDHFVYSTAAKEAYARLNELKALADEHYKLATCFQGKGGVSFIGDSFYSGLSDEMKDTIIKLVVYNKPYAVSGYEDMTTTFDPHAILRLLVVFPTRIYQLE